jgi:hypothetical protein
MSNHGFLESFNCAEGTYKYGNNSQTIVFKKGEVLNQITNGASGDRLYKICSNVPSMGRFTFYSDIYHGFSQVHVDENEFTVRILGVNYTTL